MAKSCRPPKITVFATLYKNKIKIASQSEREKQTKKPNNVFQKKTNKKKEYPSQNYN